MAFSNNPLEAFFDLVPTGAVLYAPLFDASGEVVDFRFVRLNPAGQRLLGLPAEPPRTFCEYFPDSVPLGVFAWHRTAYLTDQVAPYDFPYAGDGLNTFFRLVARRSGELLVVSFTDMADLPHSAVEQALRESQATERAARAEAEVQRQRFYEVLMALPALVATYHGPTHVYTFVNEAYQRYFPTQALVGRSLRDVLPETEAQGVLAVMDRVYQTGESSYQQELEVWLDFEGTGQPRQLFLNLFFHPLRDAQGRVDGLLDFTYDVTEQVRARRQVEQFNQAAQTARAEAEAERQRLYQVLMRMPANIALLRGPEHVYALVNAEYERLFPARTTLGRTIREVIPDIEGQGFYELFDRVYETGEPFYEAEAEAWADFAGTGELQRRYYRTTFEPIRDAQGQVTEVLNFAVDVTAQVEARQQVEQLNAELETRVQERTADLQESEGRFRTMADAAPAMLWVTDPDGQCTYLNAQWYQYTGQTEAEALGLGWTQAVHPDDAAQAGQKFLEANARRATFSLRYRLRRHDGVYRWAVDAGRPHFTPDGAYAGLVGTVFDIHEQQLAEDELHATNEQLRRTNIDLDTFVYTASHDLKSPITNIESIVLALLDTLPKEVQQDDVVAHLLALLNQTITRFRFTIGQLTDISRLQLAHAGPVEPVVLATVVEDVRLDLVPLLTDAGTQFTVEVPDDLVVSFSPANLRSVVYNLLSNAVKYRALDRPSQVHVHAERTESGVAFTVQDNGLGMSQIQQRQLFGLFQRLHTHVEGTGVGLYITKRLVENANGAIIVHSQPGVGTTFTVTFPV